MKLLSFQAKRFWWRSFSKTLDEVEDVEVEEEVRDAVVAFYQIETRDAENRASVFRQALKHLKWLANKREMTNMVHLRLEYERRQRNGQGNFAPCAPARVHPVPKENKTAIHNEALAPP